MSLELPKLSDEEVRSELDRLHVEHQRNKGRAADVEQPGSDQNTLAEAEQEIRADAKAMNEKKQKVGTDEKGQQRELDV